MVHLLAVRSGLFAIYSCIAVAAVTLIIVKRMFMYGLIVIGAMLLLPLLAYKFVPSVQTRVGYMLYDLQNYKDNKAIDASDGMRLRSWEVATEVAKKNILLGVGYGDMQEEMNEYYESYFPELQPAQKKLPHNQWLWVLLGSGILGLVLFGLATLYPWFKYRASENWLWHFFFVIIIGSFMWEATLEEQMGTGFFIVWLCIFLNAETILPRHEA
jgi:O-antigen ligase